GGGFCAAGLGGGVCAPALTVSHISASKPAPASLTVVFVAPATSRNGRFNTSPPCRPQASVPHTAWRRSRLIALYIPGARVLFTLFEGPVRVRERRRDGKPRIESHLAGHVRV